MSVPIHIVVPARRGSSLKNKNVRFYRGEPLLARAVRKARVAADIVGAERVVVLTDSALYGNGARYAGAEVPYVDQEHGDGDDVTAALRRYLEYLGTGDVWLALLQCTAPKLLLQSVVDALEKVPELVPTDVLMTCAPLEYKGTALHLLQPGGRLVAAIAGWPEPSIPRQELPRVWRFTGGLTVVHGSQVLAAKRSFFEGCERRALPVTEEEGLDIDRVEDFDR